MKPQASPDVLAFEGWLANSVQRIVFETSLASHVVLHIRGSFIGNSKVVEFRARTAPEEWSTGEQTLWAFMSSLAGQREIDLNAVAKLVRGSQYAGMLADVFAALLLADANNPWRPA